MVEEEIVNIQIHGEGEGEKTTFNSTVQKLSSGHHFGAQMLYSN